MIVESLLPLYPNVGTKGHAHPSPAMIADTRENQRLTELLANVAFDVEIRGVAAGSDAPAYEMYNPRLRKSDTTQEAISHLDTVSCWRGISYTQALELTHWERLFRCCLVSGIEDRLQQTIFTQLNKCEDRIDKISLLPCLIRSFPKDSPYLLDIDLSCLLRDMTDAFCDDHHSQITARSFPWSFGSGDFPRFVYNFLSTQDCIQSTPAGPHVFVSCSIDWLTFPLVTVIANVAWHPPAIGFQSVPAQVKPGAHYVIVPYRGHIMENIQQPEPKQYPEFIEYLVKKSTSEVQWDHGAELFRAKAPEGVAINDASVSETILQAKIITRFPGNVRFESTSRYAIKVNLIDTSELDTVTDNNRSRNSLLVAPCALRCDPFELLAYQQEPAFFPDSFNELIGHGMPPLSSEHLNKKIAETTKTIAPIYNGFHSNPEVSARSSKKRSNSLGESDRTASEGKCFHDSYSSDPNTELKRQKLGQINGAEMGGLLSERSSRVMEIQCPTPPYTPLTSNSNDSDPRAQLTSFLETKASPVHRTKTNFKFSPQLSQQTIQNNYHEFEKMALRKLINEPGLGDVGFEKIFMGDSEAEDWHSSDLEGLSD